MPAENYVLLETIALTQSAASVTFDNLPTSGYTDLKIVISARTSDANTGTIAYIRFNGSSSTYSSRFLQGRGDSTASGTGSTSYGEIGRIPGINSPVTDNVFSNTEITIPNYLLSNNKSYSVDGVTEANQTIAYAILTAGLWSTSSAITSILIASTAGNLVAGSTFSLYGVAALGTTPEIAPFATGGNIVAQDGTYWYHAFLSSGTFTPNKSLSCDVLVVAGGGGGGENNGGGGAGGLLHLASQSLTTISHLVTVGGGGAGYAQPSDSAGDNGSNSQFASLTAAVGGGGGGSGGAAQIQGKNGGSGGGSLSAGTIVGTGTVGQGNNGGQGLFASGNFPGGGGGGAGAVGGSAPNNSTAGSGGAGVNTYSTYASATLTGVSGFYAGGGGAGTFGGGTVGSGGSGGGGASRVSGIANTGGGGGGATRSPNVGAGNGGSGIVIIRYPIA